MNQIFYVESPTLLQIYGIDSSQTGVINSSQTGVIDESWVFHGEFTITASVMMTGRVAVNQLL